jgi:hypothetical protein
MIAPATDGPKTPATYKKFVRGDAVDDPRWIAMTQRVQEKRKARIKMRIYFFLIRVRRSSVPLWIQPA